MVIRIAKKAEELKLKTPDLITRHVGRLMYNSIKEILANINKGETLLLDFEGIKVVDTSCIDELIVKLIMDSRSSEHAFYVKLQNLSEIAEINIEYVFRSYSNYKNKKIVVITGNICQNNTFHIGPLSDQERDVIEFIRVNKSISVEDVVRFSGQSADQAKNLMEDLDALRIVKKQSNGLFYGL